MKKVFISQPMRGREQEDIVAEREKVASYLKEQGYEVLDSFVTDHAPETKQLSVWYLGKSLEILSHADAAYFCNGWFNSPGCFIEHEVCKQYGIFIIRDDI